ncbi:M23 family metallopeptidase [Nocardia salmonicida]|uniref:M23 family metallopeptidase n=1 Tax=Nocardia salmonicida TaxID=53431 RepID=UPI0033D6BF1F
MNKVTAGVLAVALSFGSVMFTVLFLLGDDTKDCAPAGTSSGGSSIQASGGKAMPMADGTYSLTSGFGPRWGTQHKGQDFGAAEGTPIYAAADGLVVEAGPASGFGQWIVLDHNIGGESVSTVYGHMWEKGVLVRVGDTVKAGQKIAEVGNNGESSGAHLHFEVVPGTRLGGGTAIDPMPWLSGAGAGTPAPSPSPSAPSAPSPAPRDSAAAATGGELAALPASKGSEAGMQVDTIRVTRTINQLFPEIQTFGGVRADPIPDHPSGRAVDVMIPDATSGQGKALGDRIADYVMANAAALQVEYIIWRQEYRGANGDRNIMEDRGGETANHFDHVHITTVGGGEPNGSPIGPAPGSAGTPTSPECSPELGHSDLAPGKVPPELEGWYRKGGTVCPQIKSSLLAAQGMQESGFRRGLTSPSGAEGLSQFLPGTAAATASDGKPYVIDADGNGTASVWDDGDAIIGQARYMCDIAAKIEGWMGEGKVSGDLTTLTLAGYNAGEGAVLSSGGFPSGSPDYETQTRPYAANILAMAAEYSKTLS